MGGKQAPEWLAADAGGIARAASLLRAGELVAVPTETVYGLAARADREAAVAAIYRAKGRPDFNPLIVHVASLEMARRLATFDERAEALAARFWPGPLTLVLPSVAESPVVPAVTAGLATVALRMPDHPAMRQLLQELDVPLAAPSANRSGAVSPTTPQHVADSLGSAVSAILDGGACPRGLESTIVALRDDGAWQLLRHGPVTAAELVALLGPPKPLADARIEAPGQLAQHYSPGKPVRLGAERAEIDEFLIGFGPIEGDCTLSETGDLALAAARLYACLHQAAVSERARVAVAPVPDEGIGVAINDRLRRAAA
ncbi:L-threonylcarbamoyladenylate synthase [Altererythrobacter sp. Root672]|uniref:L-threonylcarbamoyladenylate synthase n=1 Tax=Altererythrobacter sp. Root672 TaxID=1736584 RepID=UPI0006FDFB7F|nr:L-threonylcarbamoyladenylate synthase [Altererythrobacter sp. Root672]KRA81541.1 translation factor Sua5 [Altererythrobacter sp. Root672]